MPEDRTGATARRVLRGVVAVAGIAAIAYVGADAQRIVDVPRDTELNAIQAMFVYVRACFYLLLVVGLAVCAYIGSRWD